MRLNALFPSVSPIFFLIILSFWLSHTIVHHFRSLYLSSSVCSIDSVVYMKAFCWFSKTFSYFEIPRMSFEIQMQNILRHNSFLFCEIFTVEWWHVEMVLIMDIIYIVESPKRKLSFDFLWMLGAFEMIMAIEPYVFLYLCYKLNDTTNAAYNVCFLYKICIRFITQ